MKRTLSALLAATAAAAGLMIMPGSAEAAGGCKTMSAPGGGSAYVCKHYYSQGGGLYYGDFSVGSASSRVYAQAYYDGSVVTVTDRGGSTSGGFSDLAKFHVRVCNSGCSAWF
ncbi:MULTISPECIES: hypothetical protein [Streptomyces]|uniref:Peptidase inhibitor family I36 n=1 Tax=Streptomyces venezuelae (strain ATCC 10712 / CBS 650.69 / DSM 40230 / JCM 4526 / NBRC 13096 / PD 04745) TaxID=953739 RepID=F2RDD7_STRVP|nr:hypothetical protein [Streptomyces venezuelae]APE24907.1 hypothetical protein vnz_30340 [Streptomyces venezuelae]QES02253.1 hypothetical protein DEJ43_30825 [Streptomyces venezuelae ATCC 10712]QES09227.1 hypothetical protein DEJ44_28775 [Streptomyces venezuelae]CCA59429.1 hypothetical protein SVEN_6143 [Streptomyces venezuelae ATCC 10712]